MYNSFAHHPTIGWSNEVM